MARPDRGLRSKGMKVKNRAVAATLATVAILAAAWAGWRYLADPPPSTADRPRVDRHPAADHLPAYGYRGVETPAIDALAADGLVFEHAWAHSPQTLPSHASLFTGRLPFEHGVRDNQGFALKTGETMLAALLRARGSPRAASSRPTSCARRRASARASTSTTTSSRLRLRRSPFG